MKHQVKGIPFQSLICFEILDDDIGLREITFHLDEIGMDITIIPDGDLLVIHIN